VSESLNPWVSESLGVAREKRLHAAGEIGLRRLENDVQVIGHDRKRVNTPRTPNGGSTEVFLEPIAVDVITYDVLTAVAARHEVVDGVRVLEA